MKITISIKKNPEITKEMWKRIDKGMDDLIDAGLEKATELVPVDIGAGGGLKGALVTEKEYLDKTLVCDSPYGAYVEYGTRPHWPPPGVLDGWVHRVLNVNEPEEIEEVAYMVARKIAREGTEPQPFLRPAKDLMASRAGEIIKKRTMKK